jgi:hypothetical protein
VPSKKSLALSVCRLDQSQSGCDDGAAERNGQAIMITNKPLRMLIAAVVGMALAILSFLAVIVLGSAIDVSSQKESPSVDSN